MKRGMWFKDPKRGRRRMSLKRNFVLGIADDEINFYRNSIHSKRRTNREQAEREREREGEVGGREVKRSNRRESQMAERNTMESVISKRVRISLTAFSSSSSTIPLDKERANKATYSSGIDFRAAS